MEKAATNIFVPDDLQLQSTYPSSWALLPDKRYVRAIELLHAIRRYVKQTNPCLSPEQEAFIDRFFAGQVVVENYFGWICSILCLLSHKYSWNHGNYDKSLNL